MNRHLKLHTNDPTNQRTNESTIQGTNEPSNSKKFEASDKFVKEIKIVRKLQVTLHGGRRRREGTKEGEKERGKEEGGWKEGKE